jgi:lipoyl(octanoyl) transferase
VKGRTGVWLRGEVGVGEATTGGRRDRKIAAIGIRVSRGVTMHGFAINCDPDLSWFDRIVPCGIDDADVTSLTVETGHPVSVSDIVPLAERHLREALDGNEPGTS